MICKCQLNALPRELVGGCVRPGHRRITEFTSMERQLVIADGVQASIPAAGMVVMSGGRVLLSKMMKIGHSWRNILVFIFDFISKEFMGYRA